MAREGASVEKAQTAPHEDDDRKPDSPSDRRGWSSGATSAPTSRRR
jgi:hypothetical protein